MLIFPQLSTGALAQYPIQKERIERSIINVSEDGNVTALYDQYACQIRWALSYEDLSDSESTSLTLFFQQCEGRLQSFLFLDPTENLFAYSEDLSESCWVYNSLLTVTPGIVDPFGTTRASRLTNTSQGTLTLIQTVPLPGTVWCAFSVYMQAVTPGVTIQLTRTDRSTVDAASYQPEATWVRFSLGNFFASSISTSCDFSITIPSGASVNIFGFQLDAQPSPATYVLSTNETGVYPNCRFDIDALGVSATAPGRSSVQMSILSKANQ